MFSTVDRLNHRHFRAHLIGPKGEEALPIPPDHPLRPAVRRATSFPSDQHLRAVADQLLQQQAPPVSAVRVEVWKATFETSSLQIHPLQVAALMLGGP